MYNVIGYFKESSYLPECLVLSIQVSIDIVLDTMNGALVFTLPYKQKKNISSMFGSTRVTFNNSRQVGIPQERGQFRQIFCSSHTQTGKRTK